MMRERSWMGLTKVVAVLFVAMATGCAGSADGGGDGDGINDTGEGEAALANNPIPDAPRPTADGAIGFARDEGERVTKVHIYSEAHHAPVVLLSVRLRDVASTEKIKVRGEFQLSRCGESAISGDNNSGSDNVCDTPALKAHPYDYAPNVSGTFVLGDSPTDVTGQRLGTWSDTGCSHAKHRCMIALPEVATHLASDANAKWINLVVTADANGSRADASDVVHVDMNNAALYVMRLPDGSSDAAPQTTRNVIHAQLPMSQNSPKSPPKPRVVYQIRLEHLEGGDVIDYGSQLRAVFTETDCVPLVQQQVVLTEAPEVDASGPFDQVASPLNGSNCVDHTSKGCGYAKSGAVRVQSGSPHTMYLSLIAQSLRYCAARAYGNEVHVTQDGEMAATILR